MTEISVKVHDKELIRSLKVSPKRAKWATREAFKMAGGHFRKKLRKDIEKGRIGGSRKKSPITSKANTSGANWNLLGHRGKGPLYFMGRLIRFKVGMSKGQLLLRLGFLPSKSRFKFHGKSATIPAIAKMHEFGKRIRITPEMRRKFFPAVGHPVKKSTRFFTIPARPMIGPFFNREKNNFPKYIRERFFQKFLGKDRPDIRI